MSSGCLKICPKLKNAPSTSSRKTFQRSRSEIQWCDINYFWKLNFNFLFFSTEFKFPTKSPNINIQNWKISSSKIFYGFQPGLNSSWPTHECWWFRVYTKNC
jgi:hypothetical protein